MLIYLGLSAVATFVAALLLLALTDLSRPAVAHLVLAGGVMPLIFGAIIHFVPVLTRGGGAHRSLLLAPLLLQLAAVLTFLDFTGKALIDSGHAATGGLLIASVAGAWLVLRARRTLGRPHPGWRWYLAAILFLCMGLALVPAMHWWPAARPSLRLLHLHLNLVGFVGLTALGTLQVLLPTLLSGPDAEAAKRLRDDLLVATGGVLVITAGAVLSPSFSLVGMIMLLAVTIRIVLAWLRRYGWRSLTIDAAAAPLAGALLGFVLVLGLGVAHAFATVDGHDTIPAFVVAFLLPLVTGALTQLLPVWFRPGKKTPDRERMRAALRSGGALRALLFLFAGLLLGLGIGTGIWLAAVGLLSFLIALLHALAALAKRGKPASSG